MTHLEERAVPFVIDSVAFDRLVMELSAVFKNYKDIYPEPNDVDIIPTTSLAEVRRTKSPSALIEVAYHDNPEEAQWIRDNINAIGRNLAKSVAEYFNMPFVEP